MAGQQIAGQIKQKLRHNPKIYIIFPFKIGIIRPVIDAVCLKINGIIWVWRL